jgi:hypothetical protein
LRKRFSNHRDPRHSGRGSEFPEQSLGASPPAFVLQANEEAIVALVQIDEDYLVDCEQRGLDTVSPGTQLGEAELCPAIQDPGKMSMGISTFSREPLQKGDERGLHGPAVFQARQMDDERATVVQEEAAECRYIASKIVESLFARKDACGYLPHLVGDRDPLRRNQWIRKWIIGTSRQGHRGGCQWNKNAAERDGTHEASHCSCESESNAGYHKTGEEQSIVSGTHPQRLAQSAFSASCAIPSR